MHTKKGKVSRRGALAVMAAAPWGAAACASRPAPATPNTPLTDYIKMRGALDDQLVISFLTGRYYGVQDAVVTPFYGLEAATFSRFQPAADGGYRASTFEIAYFTDLESGAAMETWRNPYTGEDVAVPVTRTDPSVFYVRPDLHIELARPYPGMAMTHRALPAREIGEDVWVTEETFVTVQTPGGAPPFRYSEIITLHASRAALDDPSLARAPASASYMSAVSWRPWQRMGDRPGTLTGQGDGRVGVTMGHLPPVWRSETARRFPSLYADPATPLNAALAG